MALNNHPVNTLLLTDAIAQLIHDENAAEGMRPKAFPTVLRASDAGKCARMLGLREAGYAPSDPVDLSGEWVMWLGRMIHDKMQRALEQRYVDTGCEVEFAYNYEGLVSGHLDAKITLLTGEVVCYELKTRGAFGFDKAKGLDRKHFTEKPPEGPNANDLLQGALNAYATGADTLVIGIIGLEAVGKRLGEKLGYNDLQRIMGEWHYDRADFEPLAVQELQRMREIASWLADKKLPPTWAIDRVKGEFVSLTLNPITENLNWQCGYCSYKTLCQFAGPGPVPLPIPGIREGLHG